jgi:L-iditol 2-dehydrogenase
MKVCALIAPGRVEIKEIDMPAVKSDGMLVKVKACGLCGSDIRNYTTGPRLNMDEQIMGHEIAGEVVETGSAVRDFSVGDRVTVAPDVSCGECYYCREGLVNLCNNHKMVGTHWPGGFAQYVYINDEILQRGMVLHMPDELDDYAATLGEPLSSVVAAQEFNQVSLGETIVVMGIGPIGCMHAQIARARGAKVIMVGRRRLEFAKLFKLDYIVDTACQDPVKEVLRITNGLGADAVITATPVAESHAQAVQMVRKRGRVILFGGLPKNDCMTSFDGNKVHYGEICVVGAFSYTKAINQRAISYLADGVISADKIISRIVNLEGLQDGIEAAQRGEVLKVVVDPWK